MCRMKWLGLAAAVLATPAVAAADPPAEAISAYRQGQEAAKRDEFDRAIVQFSRAIRLDPKHAPSYYERGRAYVSKQAIGQALQDYDRAIRLDPTFADAYSARGYVFQVIRKDYERAAKDYTRALGLDPTNARALNNLAWMWATCPIGSLRDGKKAVEYATRACKRMGYQDATYLDTLAAAHAEAGNFTEAVRWQQKLLEVAGDSPSGKARLKLYQEGKPYREP
jgi:tetratricopeptide (TPR) repeat protein